MPAYLYLPPCPRTLTRLTERDCTANPWAVLGVLIPADTLFLNVGQQKKGFKKGFGCGFSGVPKGGLEGK